MDGYLVQQPFADLIARGEKVWDVRVRPIALPRRPFYILATRSPHKMAPNYAADRLGIAVAVAESHGVEGPFDVETMIGHEAKHKIPPDVLRDYAKSRPLYAMVLSASPVAPRRYVMRQGAVHTMLHVVFCD